MSNEDFAELPSAKIRLKLSGLSAFVGNALGLIIGFAFTVIVARKLPPNEFGIWGIIVYFATYPLWISRIPRYWGLRDSARGRSSAPFSALFLSVLLGILLAGIFLVIGFLTAYTLGVAFLPFAVYSLAVLFLSTRGSLEGLLMALKPHYYGPATLVFHVVRLAFVYALLVVFSMGLLGPVVATITAGIAESLTILYILKRFFTKKIDMDMIIRWIKRGWLPLYHNLPRLLQNLYALAVVAAVVTPLPIAYFRAISSVGRLLSINTVLGIGLYPKMLKGGSARDVEEVLKLMFLLTIPMVAGCLVAAPYMLALLRIEYVAATTAFQLFAISVFLMGVNRVLSHVLTGSEKVDLLESSSLRLFLKSRLFTTPSTLIVPFSLGIVVLFFFSRLILDPVLVVTLWAAAYVVAYGVSLAVRWVMAKRILPFSMPWRNLAVYSFSSLIMCLAMHFSMNFLTISRAFMESLFNLLILVAIGLVVYFIITWFFDSFFRRLIREGVKELFKIIRRY